MNPLTGAYSAVTSLGGVARNGVAAARRVESTARNLAEYLRYGGLQVTEESSPFVVLASSPMFKLRRYFPDEVPEGLPALLLVPPLMIEAEVYDVAPQSSSVRAVHECGVDVWVVDFGRPEVEPGGLARTIADHVRAVSDAVDKVREATGRDVVLSGYSQGGVFSYQAGAYRRCEGIDSIVTFGAPLDFTAAPLPIPISPEAFAKVAQGLLDTGILDRVSLPGWFNKTWTRMLDPVGAVRYRINYFKQLHDRDRLLPGEQQRQFLDSGGWTAWSGPAIRDFLQQAVVTNRMVTGGMLIGDRTVSFADLDCPILTAVGEADREGHPLSVRSIARAAPRARIFELTLGTGHFGIVAGSGARKVTWPAVASWIRWRAGLEDLPENVVPAGDVMSTRSWTPSQVSRRIQTGVDLGVEVSAGVWRSATGTIELVHSLVREGSQHLPVLREIEALQPASAISLGLLLDRAARRDPAGAALLYEDRVISAADLAHRVDSVVKGLISLGVRPGDRVGVLMEARPSALTAVAAVSRLGATAVLLRPDGELEREASLGEITWLVSDPEHGDRAPVLTGVTWCVLGGGTAPRSLPEHVVDMERIDPDEVELPAWYRPNPRSGADLAFVQFTGEGARTRARFISNRRWALSALGTASAAALRPDDTVYSVTPLHHPSALLMAVGAAIAAGSRLAMASGTDQDTFWEEVRRYGATHVSYTWTSLRAVADGPAHAHEQHHPIRTLFGSGMPPNLWRRLVDRFPGVRVLEFYASPDGEAILANVDGTKPGCVGRPLPGTAEVRVVACDPGTGRPTFGASGLARECDPGEPGVLLARSDPRMATPHDLRGVFEAEDRWQSTDDLFTRDGDGDLWLIGNLATRVPVADGWALPARLQTALYSLPQVDLAVAYPVAAHGRTHVEAALTLFPQGQLRAEDLSHAFGHLDRSELPALVHVVDRIELSTWARPLGETFRRAGGPDPDLLVESWQLVPDGRDYEKAR